MKLLFFDLETTGVHLNKHGIHQISGLVEIDGEVVEHFDLKVAPHEGCEISAEAMKIGGVTEEIIRTYPSGRTQYNAFKRMLSKYVDKYDSKDKFYLVGFNNRSFDDKFLRRFFELQSDVYFNSWFWSDSWDCMVLASYYLKDRRLKMTNFKLGTVAKTLGLVVDPTKLHDAIYDVSQTRDIFNIVTGKEPEL